MADVLPGLREIDRYVVLPNGCWQWALKPNVRGYGQVERDGRNRRAHRYVYEALVGPIPEGMTLDHTCHNTDPSCPGGRACAHRLCVNPDHLEPVTDAENQRRGARRKTHYEFTPENTFIRANRNGWRECRACMNARSRAQREVRRGNQG